MSQVQRVRCGHCPAENSLLAKFCEQCGARLERLCASCGTTLTPSARFCSQCGTANPLAPQAAPREAPQPPRVAVPSQQSEAERRQLTVMFCDLADSTALSQQIDAESLREVLRAYQDACAGVITRFGGYIARFFGDGLLVYFGFPNAYEDAADRAVRAGLGMLDAVGRLDGVKGKPLEVRIGIATGMVVIGDIIGAGASQEQAVIGETPNLAARLQGIAARNAVVVSSGTKELLGHQFAFDDLGSQSLKGLPAPVRAWRVTDVHAVESRFSATHADSLSNYIGREQELALLAERWRQSQGGEGQIVLVSGEAGIGKSRITDRFCRLARDTGHVRVVYQCSPHHVNSPFYPIVEQLKLATGIVAGDTDDAKLDKLEKLIGDAAAIESDASLFAELLLLNAGKRYRPLQLTPAEKKQRTLSALFAMFQRLAFAKPALFVLEDAHWVDPTTRELMDLIAERIVDLRALMIVTHRPEFETHWSEVAHCTKINLNRLGRKACGALIADITGGRRLPDEVHEQIVAKTDGIPLFVEELTKMVLESGLLIRNDDRYALAGPLAPLAIPSTLHDSLMARLDRLEGVKEICQIGATIGREFPHALLEAVAPIRGAELERALTRLSETEILFRRGALPEATYVFKHALIQDAAYESLLRGRRQQIHARIAQALRVGFAARVESEPEVLALHYTRAGRLMEAAPWWLRAGQQAIARSANIEAVAHLIQGLRSLQDVPEDLARTGLELDMQISLGSAQIAMRGYSAAETEHAYLRARELLTTFAGDPREFAVLHGLCMVYWNRAQLTKMVDVCKDMLARAERQSETLPRLVAHRVMAVALNPMGRFMEARAHAEKAVALYDPERHRDSAHRFGHDMAVGAYWHLAIACMFLGDNLAAGEASARASALASRSQNANTLLYDFLYLSFAGVARSDWPATRVVTSSMINEAVSRNMALWEVFGRHHLGCALAATGEPEAALQELRRARQSADQLNNAIFKPMTLGFEALALAGLRRFDEAINCLDQALGIAEETKEQWWEPELHRYRGLVERQRGGAAAACEGSFRRAIDIARRQGSKLFESRAMAELGDR